MKLGSISEKARSDWARPARLTSFVSGLTALAIALLLAGPGRAAAELTAASHATPGPYALKGTLEQRFEDITAANLDPAGQIEVRNQLIDDRVIKLHLVEGIATPLRTPTGATIGFWFIGRCELSYSPPLGQERAAFERGTGKRRYDKAPCTEAFALSDQQRELSWLMQGSDSQGGPSKNSSWVDFILDSYQMPGKQGRRFVPFAVSALANHLGAVEPSARELGLLQLEVLGPNFGRPKGSAKARTLDWLGYSRNPEGQYAADEPITLRGGHFQEKDRRYAFNLSSHGSEQALRVESTAANLDLVDAKLDLDIDVGFDPWAEMKASATLTLTTRRQPTQAVALDLLREHRFGRLGIKRALGFTVQQVTDFKGRPLEFLHFGGKLLIRLRSPLPPGQGEVLTVNYHGNAMPRLTDDSFGLLANYSWWPQPGRHDRFTFGAVICTPKAFRAAGTGTTMRRWEQGSKVCEDWQEKVPITFPAINMGRWVSAEKEGPSGVRLRAFFLREDEHKMEAALNSVAEMLRFFENLFGPYPFGELDIAEARANMYFWQAPAGLLELSRSQWSVRTAAKDQRKDFYPHASLATLAHEVAHQWWGHVVGWKSYRDQWMSESFAEYSSFLFMAQYEGQRSYLGRLEYWEVGARKTQRRAPMVLGFRDRRGYQGQVYRRGPHALHMLRRSVGDQAFMAWMGQLPRIAANRNLSTADLKLITERTLGTETSWFFDQWIERSGLPKLELAAKQQGKKLKLRLRQTQVLPPFRLWVPLRLHYADGSSTDHILATESRELTDSIKLLNKGLQKVELDPDRELCLEAREVRLEKAEQNDQK